MKIHEIISEDAKTGLLTKAGGWLVNKLGGGAITKAMGKSEFIDAEAHAIANLAKTRGVSVATAMQMSHKEEMDTIRYSIKRMNPRIKPAELETQARAELLSRKPHMADASVISKIEQKAGIQSGINALGKAGEVAGKAWQAGVYGLQAWGLYEMWAPPLKDYWESMGIAKANLDSGAWSIENYHHEENKQLSTLIGRLGAALLITSVPALLLNNKLTRAILGKYLGGILAMGTAGGVLYLRKWLNRDDNADNIAAVMMNDYIAGNAEVMGTPIPGLGSLAAKAKQAIMGDVEADPSKATDGKNKQDTSPTGTTTTGNTSTNTPGKQDIDSTAGTGTASGNSTGTKPGVDPKNPDGSPTSSPYITPKGRKMYSNDPLALRNYDITGWVRKPGQPGWIMNPADKTDILQEPPGWTPD